MKQVLINDNNLTIEDMESTVIRVKAMIINSNNEMLLAHNNGTYQFPGGHKEDDEEMEETLIREIKEETGINISLDMGPFMQVVTYDANYFGMGKKVCNKIYYYIVYTDEVPNYNETNYDELECQTDFNLVYISVDKVHDFFLEAIEKKELDENIGREMLMVIDEYKVKYGRD